MTQSEKQEANILVVQCGPSHPEPAKNVDDLVDLVSWSLERYRPDFIVFSELSSTQYFCGSNDPALFSLAEPLDGRSVHRLQKLAADAAAYLLFPFFERGVVKGEYFNSCAVIGRQGELLRGRLPNGVTVSCYRKAHIPDQYSYSPGLNERYYFKGGPGLPTFDTEFGRIGVLICYERSFPEAWRVLALQGATVVFLPVAAWGPNRAASWGHELLTAAVQNGVFVVAANKGGAEKTELERHFYGGSRVITPFGKVLSEAPRGEGPATLECTIDFGDVDAHGVRYTFFRDRRPELYASLADDTLRNVY